MGSPPVDHEIPVEFNDFYIEVQEAFIVYYQLKDNWDGFNGNYLGKQQAGIKDRLEILEIPKEDWKTILELIDLIDHYRGQYIKKSSESKQVKDPA